MATTVEKSSEVTILDSSEEDDIEFIRKRMNGKDVSEWLEEFMQPREFQKTLDETSNDTQETENLEIDLTKGKNRAARRSEESFKTF